MKRFVLTGGHGVGKSSIILALEQLGEHVVFEAASSVCALDHAQGVAFPEDRLDFEARALALHLQRERAVPEAVRRVFLDRAAPDHLAYRQVGKWPLSRAEEAACRGARYDAAFLVEPPPGGVPTLGRVEAQFCERLVLAIEQVYQQAGTPLVRVPYGECRNRALFILETVRQRWPETDNVDEPGRNNVIAKDVTSEPAPAHRALPWHARLPPRGDVG